MDTTDKTQNPALKELFGRMVNNMNEAYMLPADLIEHARLDSQHEAICLILGAPFPRQSGVDRLLSPRPDGYKPRVLDIGTGAGSWAIAIATACPHVEVVGLDVAPVNASTTQPENCRFEQGDAHTDLDRLGCFDVIHARAVLQGIKDFTAFFAQVAAILNPGGMFLTIEPEMSLFDEAKEPFGIQDANDPAKLLLVAEAVHSVLRSNYSFAELPKVRSILESVAGDPWERIAGDTFYLPVGPFLEDPSQRIAGELMRQASMKMPRGIQPLLILHGYSPEDLNRWAALAEDQMTNMTVKFYMKLEYYTSNPVAMSSDNAPGLKEFDGRLYNTTSESYLLPADNIEHRRLDTQHQAIITMLGGLTPVGSGVDELLATPAEHQPRILDIGTGSGAWAIDMAIKYPNAEVVGLDLAPVNPAAAPPSNCRFEQGDASISLKSYDVSEVLSLGGIIVIIEVEMGLYNEHKVPFADHVENVSNMLWSHKMAVTYVEATTKRNPSYASVSNIPEILGSLPGEPRELAKQSFFLVPCGPIESVTDREREAGKLMQRSIIEGTKGIRLLLLACGYDPADVDHWTQGALNEIAEGKAKYWVR
ncbi:hypothetical protein FRB90_003767, partial [Tulasnella sp. 427]